MVNFGLLAAEIVWFVWGTPANNTGLCLYTRLQNGVDRVSRLLRVNESLDITNH